MVLRLRGAEVFGLDVLDSASAKPQWLAGIGGTYIDGRSVQGGKLAGSVGPMDVILEAAGIASLDFDLLDVLALNGIFLLTGIPGGDRPLQIDAPALMRTLVLKNQVMLGSVNASLDHFHLAVADLSDAAAKWPGHVEKLITHVYPPAEFAAALGSPSRDEIKTVIQWGEPQF
jgi:threonine dehydrogenase-like Zn-dependent dehydrogenase